MRFLPTAAQFKNSELLLERFVAKLAEDKTFDARKVTHAELLYCYNNDVDFDGVMAYSPPLTEAQVNLSVPEAWPESLLEVEGEEPRQKTYAEYTHALPVEDNKFCLLFTMTAKGPSGAITYVNLAGFKIWVAKVKQVLQTTDGFISHSEYETIRVVPEPVA